MCACAGCAPTCEPDGAASEAAALSEHLATFRPRHVMRLHRHVCCRRRHVLQIQMNFRFMFHISVTKNTNPPAQKGRGGVTSHRKHCSWMSCWRSPIRVRPVQGKGTDEYFQYKQDLTPGKHAVHHTAPPSQVPHWDRGLAAPLRSVGPGGVALPRTWWCCQTVLSPGSTLGCFKRILLENTRGSRSTLFLVLHTRNSQTNLRSVEWKIFGRITNTIILNRTARTVRTQATTGVCTKQRDEWRQGDCNACKFSFCGHNLHCFECT